MDKQTTNASTSYIPTAARAIIAVAEAVDAARTDEQDQNTESTSHDENNRNNRMGDSIYSCRNDESRMPGDTNCSCNLAATDTASDTFRVEDDEGDDDDDLEQQRQEPPQQQYFNNSNNNNIDPEQSISHPSTTTTRTTSTATSASASLTTGRRIADAETQHMQDPLWQERQQSQQPPNPSQLGQAMNNASAMEECNDVDYDNEGDDVTVFTLDATGRANDMPSIPPPESSGLLAWINPPDPTPARRRVVAGAPTNGFHPPEWDEARRQVLIRELRRVQRASFLHFFLLCLIPTCLLFVVSFMVLGQDNRNQQKRYHDCVATSGVTGCTLEPRTFLNAFSTRCVCPAISIFVSEDRGDDKDDQNG